MLPSNLSLQICTHPRNIRPGESNPIWEAFMRKITALVLVALFFAPKASAQPLADKVPANPVIYFGWSGSDNLGPAYADSHTKALLDQSNFPAVFNDMIPRAVARISMANKDAGEVARTIVSIGSPMWRHPCAFFLADVEIGEKMPSVHAGILCQAGADGPKLVAQFQKLIAESGKCPIPMRAYQSGDIVAFTIGYGEDEDAIKLASAKSLAGESAFTNAWKQVQKDPVLTMYINCEHIWSIIDNVVEAKGDKDAKEYWPKIREASGLPGLKRILATGAFDGKDWMEQAFVESAGPRTGLMSMLDVKPLSEDFLKLAPADANTMFAGTFDIAKFLGVIRTAIAQVDPQAGEISEKVVGALSLYVGRDFQKEVLDPLGEHWLSYASPTIAGRGLFGVILINELDDPKKAEQGLMATQIAAFNTVAGFLSRVGMTLRGQNIKADGLSINYWAIPLLAPSWSVKDKYLIAALFPQNVISAHHFIAGGGKSILENPNFADLRKRLGGPSQVAGVSYVDLQQTAGDGYQGLLVLSRLALGAGDLFGVKSPEPVIPPLDVLLKHVAPCGSIAWVDDAGWHSKSIASFPGAQILGGGNNAALGMIMQMVPALAPVIGREAHVQADQTQELARAAYLNLNPEQRAAWVNQTADVTYVGKGQKLTTIKRPSDAVLAYQKALKPDGKLVVVFADGHPEIAEAGRFKQLLER
jgi:hypothetical protein